MLTDFEAYCEKAKAMRERGIQIGDILICDEGAPPKPHRYTQRLCVRVMEYCIIDGTGPRFFIHGYSKGLVAYIPAFVQDEDNSNCIQPGTKFQVVKKFASSIVIKEVDNVG